MATMRKINDPAAVAKAAAALGFSTCQMQDMLRGIRASRTERWLLLIGARALQEERDRNDWIEGIRRRLGLVSEVHDVEWWQVGEDYWMWACLRPGCPYADRLSGGRAATSMGRVRADAWKHRRRFWPSVAEPELGAGLDLTGFHRPWRGLDG